MSDKIVEIVGLLGEAENLPLQCPVHGCITPRAEWLLSAACRERRTGRAGRLPDPARMAAFAQERIHA